LLDVASGPGPSLFCQEMAVILEGVDSLRVSSQKLLAALLQKTELMWVLIGNDKKKIIPALQTFCTVLDFTTTEGAESDAVRGAFGARLLQIVAAEGFSCSHAVVDRALADHLPDLRKTLAEVDWAVRTP